MATPAEITYLQNFVNGNVVLSGATFRQCISDGYIANEGTIETPAWYVTAAGYAVIQTQNTGGSGVNSPGGGTTVNPGTGATTSGSGVLYVTDGLTFASTAARFHGQTVAASDTMIVAQPKPGVRSIGRPPAITRLQIHAGAVSAGTFHYALISAFKAGSRVAVAVLMHVASALKLGDAYSLKTLLKLIETVELSARLSIAGMYAQSISTLLTLHGASSSAWLKAVQTSLRAGATVADTYTASIRAAEALVFDEAVSVKMIVQVVMADDIAIDDGISGLRALYRQQLVEVVDFGVRLRNINGTTTTWAVNTRTGAVTEYTNYAMNSIVKMPDGSYLGAGEDGNLYQLQGSSDNSVPIIADMLGGILDLGGSRFTQLKAAYLGMRANGVFYMKLTTNNDVTRTYEVRVRPMKTARIDIGKGLRSRYLQWELISTGQTFDLTSIEFVPLISTRRV